MTNEEQLSRDINAEIFFRWFLRVTGLPADYLTPQRRKHLLYDVAEQHYKTGINIYEPPRFLTSGRCKQFTGVVTVYQDYRTKEVLKTKAEVDSHHEIRFTLY